MGPRTRRRSRLRRNGSQRDAWEDSCDSDDDGLPDWKGPTDEEYIQDLKHEIAKRAPKKADIMTHGDIVSACLFLPIVKLRKSLQSAIARKLSSLDGVDFADYAVLHPRAEFHVLLWWPDQSQRAHLSQLLPAPELHRTRLFALQGTPVEKALGPHLLGFCEIQRIKDPATGASYNGIEVLETLCRGYNIGQLLYQLAGERCLKGSFRLQSALAKMAGGGSALAPAAGSSSSAAPPSLARWPLPITPLNIYYWLKLEERIPALGRGAFLRCLEDATAAAAGAGAGETAAGEHYGQEAAFRRFLDVLRWDQGAIDEYLRACELDGGGPCNNSISAPSSGAHGGSKAITTSGIDDASSSSSTATGGFQSSTGSGIGVAASSSSSGSSSSPSQGRQGSVVTGDSPGPVPSLPFPLTSPSREQQQEAQQQQLLPPPSKPAPLPPSGSIRPLKGNRVVSASAIAAMAVTVGAAASVPLSPVPPILTGWSQAARQQSLGRLEVQFSSGVARGAWGGSRLPVPFRSGAVRLRIQGGRLLAAPRLVA